MRVRRNATFAVAVLATALSVAAPARAATFTVTSTDDAGTGTLRAAMTAAQAPGPHTIALPVGTITLQSALPQITQDVTIAGAGPTRVERNPSAPAFRLFATDPGTTVDVGGVTLANGDAGAERGGTIRSLGALRLHDCAIGPSAATSYGGAVSAGGPLEIARCTIRDSTASVTVPPDFAGVLFALGGAVAALVDQDNPAGAGPLSISDSVLLDNRVQMTGSQTPDAEGGAVYAEVPTTITRSVLRGNAAIAGGHLPNTSTPRASGGGVYAYQTALTIVDSTVADNLVETTSNGSYTGSPRGGGVFTGAGGPLVVTGSTIAGNVARGLGESNFTHPRGGGIAVSSPAQPGRIERSTITGNVVDNPSLTTLGLADGAGLSLAVGTLSVTGTTIAGNAVQSAVGTSPRTAGGGISVFPHDGDPTEVLLQLGGSIVAGNGAPNFTDANGPIASLGGNVIGDGESVTKLEANDRFGSAAAPLDPLLGPLADNGGPTWTLLPLPGSPAIDAASAFGATTDQRGTARPLDDAAVANGDGGDGSDAGAVEAPVPTPGPAPAPPSPTPQPPAGPPAAAKPARLSLGTAKRLRADRRGRVKLRLRCAEAACAGTLRGKGIARVAVDIAAGRSATVTVRLSKSLRRKLARKRKLTIALRFTPTGGGTHKKLGLKVSAPKR